MKELLRNSLGLAITALLSSASVDSFAQSWAPPEPSKAERDWVKLSSGEWIWGDIKYFEDLDFYFDSEEFDDVTIDWEDVIFFRSARTLTYRFTRDRIATGTATMEDGIIRVQTATGVEEYSRRDLLKIIEGDLSELNFWSLLASVGLTARAGNTEQTDINSVVKIRRDATRTRINIDYVGNYSKVDTATVIENNRLAAGWKVIIKRGFFITPLSGELYTDRFQNIESRTTIGAAAGIFIFRRKNLDWDIQLGGSYRKTRYLSVEPGQAGSDETGSIVPSTRIDADVTSGIELDFSYDAQIGVPDPKDSTHHLQALLEIDFLGDVFDLTVNFTWDRIENPVTNADGVTPKRDDYRLALGFAVDL